MSLFEAYPDSLRDHSLQAWFPAMHYYSCRCGRQFESPRAIKEHLSKVRT